MQKFWTPELLSPAGGLEKLKVAVSYGASAVYLGGLKFGLRAAADNFTLGELEEGVTFAHQHGSKVYVVINSFLHDRDLVELPEFVRILDSLKVDAVIVSDLGSIQIVKANSTIPIHLSTQASCLNVASAKIWKKMGVTRVVLGREVSISEAAKIKKEAQVEVEMFVHGSMCMAYSGNCVISNYTQGRDSNRGGCAHSCRFEYSLADASKEEKLKSHFMSSKDLNGIRVLEEFIKAGIDSLKVEGRMKSQLYTGTMSKVYSEALNFYKDHGHFYSDDLYKWEKELSKVPHRSYSQANLIVPAGADTIFNERELETNEYLMSGVVVDVCVDSHFVVDVRSAFNTGDVIEVVPFKGEAFEIKIDKIEALNGELIERTKPNTLIKLPYFHGVELNHLIRQHVEVSR